MVKRISCDYGGFLLNGQEAEDFNRGNNVSDDCMTVSDNDDDDDYRPTWWFPVERSKLNSHWHNLWSCRETEWDKQISY